MSLPRLRTALVGAGRVGAGYADDPATARHFRFATHAQVLAAHPALEWCAVVDISGAARERVRAAWDVPGSAPQVTDLARGSLDLVVIATPPAGRLELVRSLGDVKAILLEKPMAADLAEATALVEHCARRRILLQVALWRRADPTMRSLAAGKLADLVGTPLVVSGVYGNGIRNNGTHLIDLVRMLVGEIEAVQALGRPRRSGPLDDDVDLPFLLRSRDGLIATFQPIPFRSYRENALDVWAERGRVEILQEGLRCVSFPLREHRAMSGEREIASDAPNDLGTGAGDALYGLYENLVSAIRDGTELWSPGASALGTEAAIDAVLSSSRADGAVRLLS